jgi:hypothetical protein
LLTEGWLAADDAAAGVVAVAAVCTDLMPCLPCLRRCLSDIRNLRVLGGVRGEDRLGGEMSRFPSDVSALELNLNRRV